MKIVVATPVKSNLHVRTAAWCASISRHKEVKWIWAQTPAPELGRNAIAHIQLQDPDVTHLFYLDSDCCPPNDGLSRLLALDQPVVAGVTPIVHDGRPCWNVGTDPYWWPRVEPLPAEPFTVDHVGGTGLLVRREVLEAIGFPWFKATWSNLNEVGVELCKEGEDIFFARRIRECGYEIWIDPTVQFHHFKTIDLLTGQEG